MSSGGALPPTSFNHFGYLFNPQPHFFTPNQQRIKMKRQRQRVDAGEPRNSYQQPRVPQKLESATKTIEQAATATPLNVTQLFPSLPWLQASTEAESESKSDLLQKLRPEGADKESTADTQENESQRGLEDAPVSNASGAESTSSSSSSSSRRKSFFPQKNASEVFDKSSDDLLDMEDESEWGAKEDEGEDDKEETTIELNNQSTGNKLNDIIEAQKKFYSNFIEQHNKMTNGNEQSKGLSSLAATLKEEIMASVSVSIDKIISEWMANQAKTDSEANRPIFPPIPSSMYHSAQSGGIFPPPFNPFMGALNNVRKEEIERRKRKMETPSVRSKMTCSPTDRDGTPLSDRGFSPMMSRSTPLSSYFPATMVGHSMYDAMCDSPMDSDDNEDDSPYDPTKPQSSTLTPMHLRKAKLMFFYTRQPNSSLLKQYFRDIRFNKNNTAQLVKWFSNFREFFYNQMDKYGKQAVAEGIKSRDDIIITKESEIFKQLNQHYNRNNHIEVPEQFMIVIQETLRQFYDAIKQGKHNKSSWKKDIYKIINILDDPIPEFFKETNFFDNKLEQE